MPRMRRKKRKPIPFDKGWKFVQCGIAKLKRILEGSRESFLPGEYNVLYTEIYDMCTQRDEHDHSELLYNKYREVFEEYMTSVVLPSLKEKHNEFLLRELIQRWLNHKVMTRWLSHIFGYLSRFFITKRSLPSLYEIAFSCFQDLVYQKIKGKVTEAVISLIDQERRGAQINRFFLKVVIDIFVEIGSGKMDYYENDFEAEMLKDTKAYYSMNASNWILVESCPNFMLKAEEGFRREKDRVAHYLHASSELKLLEIVQDEVLVVHSRQLLEKEDSGCCVLLRDGNVDDLSRMYRLFSKIQNGLDLVSQIYKKHLIAEGTALVKQADGAASNKKSEKNDVVGLQEQIFVKKIIELHDKYMTFVNDCFQNHILFHKALNEAFEIFCNKSVAGSSTAELLATYCDNILKKSGSEKLNDEAIEEILEKVMKLLVYISDKDLFSEFCRKKLARRLLFDKSANKEHEISFLRKLKKQHGALFTSKMEGMITDQIITRENQANFGKYLRANPQANTGLDLTVTILTSGLWPSYRSSDLKIPSEMVKCVQVFREFYQTQTKRRKLTWIYSLGTCYMNANLKPKTMELVVTTYQAAVLLLFNGSERLSYSDIMSQLNLTNDDVVRLLHSLSCSKYKILNKEPSTNSISSNDIFEVNSKFTDKMRRIKIPLPPPVDEKKKIVEVVDKDRRFAIDASLVRIMKSRKVLNHQQLITECVEQLSPTFKPDFKLIKKRIEDLMKREYLERDSEDMNLYKYLN